MSKAMSLGARLWLSIVSVFLPGEAHGQTDRRRAALAWAVLGAVAVVAGLFTMWGVLAATVIRLACAITSFVQLRKAGAVLGWGAPAALTAAVLGAVSLGLSGMAVRTFKAPSSSMIPTIDIGDRLIVSRAPYWLGSPAPGDVIAFDMPCEPGRQYLKRIIATGGQSVEVRCGVVYVDAKPLPAKLVDATAHYDDYNDMDGKWFPRDASAYDETLGDRTYRIFDAVDRANREVGYATKDFPRVDGSHLPPSCATQDVGFDRSPRASKQAAGTIVETKPNAAPCELQLHYVVPADHVFVLGDNRANSNDSRFWGSVPTSLIIGRVLGVYYAGHGGWGHVGAVR